jgi:1-phosphatidylinositol-4-phosphate 5-kinase
MAERTAIVSTDSARNRSDSQHLQRTSTDNTVIQRAQTEAIKTEKLGSNEQLVPHRTLGTVRSPSAERTNDRNGMTLPIVDEAGESSSTGGRSNQDAEENGLADAGRPPTPPKDKDFVLERRPKHEKTESYDSNKALPAIPLVKSPEPMKEKDSVFV